MIFKVFFYIGFISNTPGDILVRQSIACKNVFGDWGPPRHVPTLHFCYPTSVSMFYSEAIA